jgi:micrococcal nuclease
MWLGCDIRVSGESYPGGGRKAGTVAVPLGSGRTRLAVLAVVALLAGCTGETATSTVTGLSAPVDATVSTSPADTSSDTNALVTRVIDGDTIDVRHRGELLAVRLIGIDTPESVAPDEPVQCYALEASAYTTERLDGEPVRLEFDVERIDPFDRTLAYVWLGDELFNETLVREGYAFVTTFPPNVRYVRLLRAAQREARSADRGVWGRCVRSDECDPAYPDGCIPPTPPDLDCSDVHERSFAVLPPDPHNFDGDHNGIGCETG